MSLGARPGGLLALSQFLIQEEERMSFAETDAIDEGRSVSFFFDLLTDVLPEEVLRGHILLFSCEAYEGFDLLRDEALMRIGLLGDL